MRTPGILNRRLGRGLLAGVGIATVIAGSACAPLPGITKAAGGTKSSNVSTGTSRPLNYDAIYATRIAKPKAVTNAPALTSYPWAADQTNAPDSYGLTRRQCVSYAAWYVNAHGTPFGYNTKGPDGVAQFGNATDWDAAARKAGFKVSSTPKVGSIAQWHTNEVSTWIQGNYYYTFQAGQVGHVGVVVKVYADKSVDVAQYNLGDARNFSVNHMKAPRYIYVPLANPSVK